MFLVSASQRGNGAEGHLPSMRRLKGKEVKRLLRDFIGIYPSAAILESAMNFDEHMVGEEVVYFVDGTPLIVRTKSGLLPSLKFEEVINSLPRIIVDMGAVAHIANGADIMRPGVKDVHSDFAKGSLVVIVDEKYSKPIALGLAEVDSAEMRLMSKGKVIGNLHYVGDDLWKSFGKSG
jgi:PUA domain protein